MNINYDEIITKANERKVVLQNIVATLKEAEEMYDKMSEVVGWLIYLNDMFKRLDQEGRELLPKRERVAMVWLDQTIESAGKVIGNRQNESGIGYFCSED